MARHQKLLFSLAVGRFSFLLTLLAFARPAAADAGLDEAIRGLGSPEPAAVQKAITTLGERGDPAALPALEALYDDRLKVGPDGTIYLSDDRKKTLSNALTGAV